MKKQKILLHVTDVQNDFGLEDGKLTVNQKDGRIENEVIPNMVLVLEAFIKEKLNKDSNVEIMIVFTGDSHSKDDAEMSVYPLHCEKGTRGEKIFKQIFHLFRKYQINVNYIENKEDSQGFLDNYDINYFEKQCTDIWDLESLDGQPARLQCAVADFDPDRIICFGLATNICAYAGLMGYVDRGYDCEFVRDASAGLTIPDSPVYPSTEEDAINKMRNRGVIITAAEEVANSLS